MTSCVVLYLSPFPPTAHSAYFNTQAHLKRERKVKMKSSFFVGGGAAITQKKEKERKLAYLPGGNDALPYLTHTRGHRD